MRIVWMLLKGIGWYCIKNIHEGRLGVSWNVAQLMPVLFLSRRKTCKLESREQENYDDCNWVDCSCISHFFSLLGNIVKHFTVISCIAHHAEAKISQRTYQYAKKKVLEFSDRFQLTLN